MNPPSSASPVRRELEQTYLALLSRARDKARASLKSFTRQAWEYVEPENRLEWNWHLDAIYDALTEVRHKRIKRLIINQPPGTMKSMALVFWAAWIWTTDPGKRFLTASYTDHNTIRDNLRVRSIVTSQWYRNNFWSEPPVSLSGDQSAKVRFDNTSRGYRIATSVGGVATGEHPDYIIVDDPLKAKDVRSETAILACNEWMDNTISTRIANDPAIIVVMQRLHQDDLSGHLLRKGGWEHILLPMRYRPMVAPGYPCSCHSRPDPEMALWSGRGVKRLCLPDPRDIRTEPGELLWPSKWPEEKVRQEELDLGEFGTAGQLGQDPVPPGGALFKREWFKIVDAIPSDAQIESTVRGWDIAETDAGEKTAKTRDWTAGVKISLTRSGDIYVTHATKVQASIVDTLIKTTAKVDGPKVKIREGSGSGKATIKARAKLLSGYDYAPSPEWDDKISRANPFRAQAQAGNVHLLRADWNEEYLDEMCSFPVGSHDDYVDASSNAYNELAGNAVQVIGSGWVR